MAGKQFANLSLDLRRVFSGWNEVGGDNVLRRDLRINGFGGHMGIEQCARRKLERGRLLGGWDETRGSSRWRRHLDGAIHASPVVEHCAFGRQRCLLVDCTFGGFHVAGELRLNHDELERGGEHTRA